MSRYYPQLLPATLVAAILFSSVSWADSTTMQVKTSQVASKESNLNKVTSHLRATSETLTTLQKRASSLVTFESATENEEVELQACQENAPCIIDVTESKAEAREAYFKALRDHESDIDAIAVQYQSLANNAEAKSEEKKKAIVSLLKATQEQMKKVAPDIDAVLQNGGSDFSELPPASYKALSDFGLGLGIVLVDADGLGSSLQALAMQKEGFLRQKSDLEHYSADMHAYSNSLKQDAYAMRGNIKKFENNFTTTLILNDLNGAMGTVNEKAFSTTHALSIEPVNMDPSVADRMPYSGQGRALGFLENGSLNKLEGLINQYLK